MTDFRKLMRMASEHTAQVETEYARKQRRNPPPVSINPRQMLQSSSQPSLSLKDLQQRTAKVIQETRRELRQKPSVTRTPSATTRAPNASDNSQRVPAKSSATTASPAPRSFGKAPTKRTATAVRPRQSLNTTRSPIDSNRQPNTTTPPAKDRVARARMSYSDLLKQAPDRLDVRRPATMRASSQLATDNHTKPLAKTTNPALAASAKPQRTAAALTSARKTKPAHSLVRKPVIPRRAAPEPALDLVPLKRAERDRRTIEEVQLASRRKRQATASATHEASSASSAARSARQPPKRPRARSPSPIVESRQPRPRYAGKKVPSATLSEHPSRVPQKRPPTTANGAPGKRPAPLTSTTPKSKASNARPRVHANGPSASPSRRPSGYQYGGKRPPTGSAQTIRPVRRVAPPPRPNYPGRRSLDDVRSGYADDDEYDSDLDDFIVDDDEDSDGQGYGSGRKRSSAYADDNDSDDEQHQVSSVLKDLFGYDRSKYANGADDDDDDMETSAHTLRLEEARSARIARQEDEREEELERQAEEQRRRRRMQKRRG
ncbi:Protein SPT2 [Dimargaris xerosporica]|nr:Protein SPT2 [Dimargaris xerosporica]